MPIIGRPKTNPWEIHSKDLTMIRNHILYGKLKGKKLNFSVLDNYLDRFDDDFWNNLLKIIPESWMSEDFDKIVNHIKEIRVHQQAFIAQIKNILS